VGWAKLNKVCGNPPTRCAYEGAGVAAALSALPSLKNANPPGIKEGGIVPDRQSPPGSAPPITSNVQQATKDGLGCINQPTIQAVSNCETAQPAKDCVQQRAELMNSKACFAITSGTVGAIEAGSHSFDWLRVRVPGTIQPLWTARSLFLKN
jgi:hypothetical protein